MQATKWPKVLPRKFGLVERFNRGYPVVYAPDGFRRTLEVGAGLGEHLEYERLTPEQEASYYALELRANMASRLRERFPHIQILIGDCQDQLEFPDASLTASWRVTCWSICRTCRRLSAKCTACATSRRAFSPW